MSEATITPDTPKPNPRTERSRQRLAEACTLISELLESGEWVPSNEIHRVLRDRVSEGMFGRAKQALGIEHRRVRPADGGRAAYEWRLPHTKPAPRRRAKS